MTLLGTATESRESQSSKALRPMELTLSGKSIEPREVQPLKANVSMVVKLLGSVMESRDSHDRKALSWRWHIAEPGGVRVLLRVML